MRPPSASTAQRYFPTFHTAFAPRPHLPAPSAPLPHPAVYAAAVSIETGMQSAAMGYALSTKHFANVLVAVPSSVSIVFMVGGGRRGGREPGREPGRGKGGWEAGSRPAAAAARAGMGPGLGQTPPLTVAGARGLACRSGWVPRWRWCGA